MSGSGATCFGLFADAGQGRGGAAARIARGRARLVVPGGHRARASHDPRLHRFRLAGSLSRRDARGGPARRTGRHLCRSHGGCARLPARSRRLPLAALAAGSTPATSSSASSIRASAPTARRWRWTPTASGSSAPTTGSSSSSCAGPAPSAPRHRLAAGHALGELPRPRSLRPDRRPPGAWARTRRPGTRDATRQPDWPDELDRIVHVDAMAISSAAGGRQPCPTPPIVWRSAASPIRPCADLRRRRPHGPLLVRQLERPRRDRRQSAAAAAPGSASTAVHALRLQHRPPRRT